MRVRFLYLLPSLVLCGQALKADFAAGMLAYEKHDYATAVKEWRPLAEAGDAPSQFNLGLMYLDGVGVPQNSERAVEWFRRSADRGYAKAQYNLGSLYAVGHGVRRDLVTAHMWMNLCASSGDAKCAAQRDLIARKLKARDLAAAQRRAAEWKPITPETK
jgi:TPR repeat protein